MKINLYSKNTLLLTFLLVNLGVYAQTVVSSMAELLPYLDDDNVNIVMTPGTYTITAEDIDNNLYGTQHPVFDYVVMLLPFEGSNSTYDFTGVKLNIDTEVFQKFGNVEVNEIQLRGSNIVIKNLTMEDIGWEKPSKSALGIALDGIGNRIEGIHITVRGSFPYGYGDMFGKGSGAVIGHNKHAAINVRGENNHVKDCTIMHYAYGHGIFVQGGINTTIEGCYIEGELRTTDDVLAEAGTGSPADLVNFMTVWEYKVPAGWMFSKQEDGIRAYNFAPHWQTGVDTATRNMTVKNCTVKRMRSGIVIGFADDTKYVENCTTIECETQYSVGAGAEVVNSRGDSKYGPLFADDYDNLSNTTADITVLDNSGAYGNDMLAFVGGQNHDLTFRNTQTYSNDANMEILLSGERRGMRFGSTNIDDYTSSGIKLYNYTNYSVLSGDKNSSSTINSCGPVTDTGTNNTINSVSCEPSSSYYEAEDYDAMSGISTVLTTDTGGGEKVIWIDAGDWMDYYISVPSTGSYTLNYRVASSSSSGVVQFQVDGSTISTTNIQSTGGLGNYVTLSETVSLTAGFHIVRLYASSGGWDINWFQLLEESPSSTAVTWVALAPYNLSLNVGEVGQLTPTIYPVGATNQNVIYTIDDPSIASVDSNGLVTANKLGSTFVNVTTLDGGLIDTSYINVSYSPTNNLALATNGGVATQSSTAYSGPPALAIDGNTDGDFGNGSVTHTEHGVNGSNTLKWWQVDLGSDKTIWDIVIYNRVGYSDRLNNFTVEVIDSNGNTTFSQFLASYPNPSINISTGDVVGKIVRISKSSDYGITLAEVEVYGTSSLSIADETINQTKIYPNPTTGSFTITNSRGSDIEIYNIIGKKLISKTIENNKEQVDINNLNNGLYFVRIDNNGIISTKKIIKE